MISAELVTLVFLLWSLVGGQITIVQHESDRIPHPTGYAPRQIDEGDGVLGYAECYGNRAVVHLSAHANSYHFVHELVHAYDCLDNGQFDGSPAGGAPVDHPDPPHWYTDRVMERGRLD